VLSHKREDALQKVAIDLSCITPESIQELGNVRPGLNAEFEAPTGDDFLGQQPVQGGQQGNHSTGYLKVRVARGLGSLTLEAVPTQQFLGVIDGGAGQADGVAVAGADIDIQIGAWKMVEFFFEFLDLHGGLVASPEQFPRDFGQATAAQCSMTFQNTETLELIQRFGTVTHPEISSREIIDMALGRGDTAGLMNAVELANDHPGDEVAVSLTGPAADFVVSDTIELFGHLTLSGNASIVRDGGSGAMFGIYSGASFNWLNSSATRSTVASNGDTGSIFWLAPGALIELDKVLVQHVQSNDAAAVFTTEPGASIEVNRSSFRNNTGAAAGVLDAKDPFTFEINNNVFIENKAVDDEGACVARVEGGRYVLVNSNSFYSGENCDVTPFRLAEVTAKLRNNDMQQTRPGKPVIVLDGTDATTGLSVFRLQTTNQPQQLAPRPKLENVCEGAGGLVSLGFNIATDESCGLDNDTDLPGTDPMFAAPNADGISTPMPGSPAIDIGPDVLVTFSEEGSLELPCGWVDITGLGRPQDGDGDGGFECDAGPVEVQGAGAIQAGHSGAFFNSLRNGEGEYVEVLEDGRTVIYTFSYNPAGDGAAWLIGVGKVAGNSLVTEDLLRPEGTAWGDDFDTEAIDFADWGGMSMVFPACAMNEAPGNVAFSGNDSFEPLLTTAERLTDILGCGPGITPHANAGLSGSFYDPARNGEGLVIQYLPDGRVLAIMFTYGPDGRQMWLFGVAEASDKTVTLDVVYPTGFTPWGGDFDPTDVALAAWGTWTLTWTGCDTLTFEYASTVPGYGSGSRNYTRLTKLLGTQCPAF
jgi:hypothetical protein